MPISREPTQEPLLTPEIISGLVQTCEDHVIICTTDINENIRYYNSAFKDITGLTDAELAGQPNPLLQNTHNSPSLIAELKETLHYGEMWKGELAGHNRQGSLFYLQTTVKPLLDDDAQTLGYVFLYTDVTSDKVYREAFDLLSSVNTCNNAFEELTTTINHSLNVPWAGIGLLHKEANVIEIIGLSKAGEGAAPYHYSLSGSPCNDVIQCPKHLCIEQDLLESYPDAAVLIDTHAKFYAAEPLVTPDGSVIGILWIIDDQPKCLGALEKELFHLAARRATIEAQRLDQERALKRQIRGLRALGQVNSTIAKAKTEQILLKEACNTLVNQGEFAIAWIDYLDPSARNSLATKAESHAPNFSLYNTSEIESIKAILSDKTAETQAISSKTSVVEIKTTHPITIAPVDETYAYSVIALPLTIQGAILGVLTIVEKTQTPLKQEDIRPLKSLAGNLTYGILHLRTLEEKHQVEKQLKQSHRMETIGQLTAGIAHDFNNILTSILGYSDLAANRIKDDDKLLKYVTNVTKAGQRAKDLIMQMLAFSKATDDLDSSQASISPEIFIKESIEMLKATFPPSITLSLELEVFGSEICIKPTELQQVVVNLAINARDAIESKGSCTIRLSKKTLKEPQVCQSCHQPFSGKMLEISVIDNGSGIAPETMPHIFETFFTTKKADTGTGIGLFNTHSIVHNRHGHIQVDSTPNIGTTFSVYLPLVKRKRNAKPVTTNENIPSPQVQPALSLRILVIDDEASSAGFLTEWLKGLGFDVTAYTDSLSAHKHLMKDKPEYYAVIADYQMPGLTGYELLTDYVSIYPGHKAILLGAKSDRHVLKTSDKGIVYVDKPVDTAKLKRLLDEH